MKKNVVFLLFSLVFGTLSAWDEFNQYSIADELRKPGVKLVAVDFYATWCEPCNAAIPKWKKLQEKYGDKGFKLIVVSVQSEGSCSQPPQWNPDKIVCDYDGDIADAWHANDLPQAFLWSWQGNLLVAHSTVDNVAAAAETYFKRIPRVFVEEGGDENIYKLVRSELVKNSKIEVVASDEERETLVKLRKKSANLNYDTKLQCKLGEEVSANSSLVISTQKRGKKDALVLELFSVEKGCLTASGTATIRGNPEQEVAEAVYNLLKNLLGDVKMPGENFKPVKNQKPATQSSNFQDSVACEYARSEAKDFAWKAYLKNYPTGECADEAKDELDKAACKKAEQKNDFDGWKEYLKEFPKGKCASKAKDQLDKTACKTAEKKNSVDGWKAYLKGFPKGKCESRAKDELDKMACKTAEKKNSTDGWHEYIKEFPKGICASQAQTALTELEEKDKKRAEWEGTYFRADEKVEGLFSGRYKLGLSLSIIGSSYITTAYRFSTGFDFNFKVFEESYGRGAGNLFVGAGIDLIYYYLSFIGVSHSKYLDYHDYSELKNNLINIPIKLNLGYEFKIKKRIVRYIGLWFSSGLSLDMDVCKGKYYNIREIVWDGSESKEKITEDFTYFTVSFAWEFTMNMIFKHGIFMYWGNSGSKSGNKVLNVRNKEEYVWGLDRILCFVIGAGVIF